MKLIFFVFFALFALTACEADLDSKNEQVDINKKESRYCNAVLELETYNDSVLSTLPSLDLQSRGLGGWFGTGLAVASADVLGAYSGFKACKWVAAFYIAATGGVATPAVGIAVVAGAGVVGAGASINSYNSSRRVGSLTSESGVLAFEELYNASQPSLSAFKNSSSLFIGNYQKTVYSDKVLSDVAKLHNSSVESVLCGTVPPGQQTTVYNGSFNKNHLKQAYETTKRCLSSYNVDFNISIVLNNIQREVGISQNSKTIMLIYLNLLKSSVKTPDDIIPHMDRYKRVIRADLDLTIEEKNDLLLAIEVSKHSADLWMKE